MDPLVVRLRFDNGLATWLPLAVGVAVYGTVMDLWLARNGRRQMTTTFHSALYAHPVGSPVLFGLWCGLFAGFTYHFAATIPHR